METNTISMYETVIDRNNKKHKVFSVRFKDLQIVTSFTEKYNPDFLTMYLLAPVSEDGEVARDKDGNIDYNNGFKDDLLEIIECALDYRESREQIEEWLDMAIAKEIINTFLGMSQFKKKSDVKEKTEWRNLFASIVQNTSMTMEDIGNLRINQMEDLLEGMNENAEALEREMKGEVKPLEGDAAIRKLMGGM